MSDGKLKVVVNDKDHMQGAEFAQVTLLEYGDYQCPYCGAAYPMIKRLQEHFGKDLRFVFRNFPLAQAHEHAVTAALAAEAAGLQGKFWQMHDLLYEHQARLNMSDILGYARIIKLDMTKFREDVQTPELLEKIKDDFRSGEDSGVEGTPSFYINSQKYRGSYEYSALKEYIEGLLGSSYSSIHI